MVLYYDILIGMSSGFCSHGAPYLSANNLVLGPRRFLSKPDSNHAGFWPDSNGRRYRLLFVSARKKSDDRRVK